MLNIVLFGPPGAGKGTQSKKLVEKYKLVHLSTGDILRAEQAAGSYLGLEARSYIDRGELVPDSVVMSLLEKYVDRNIDSPGFIFDGFPRTILQAKTLDDLLSKRGTRVHMMLSLEADETELKKRLIQRGQESGRSDDMDTFVISKRIDVYNKETSPVKEYYALKGKYKGVYGVGSVELIFRSLCDVIENVNRTSIEGEAVNSVSEVYQGSWNSPAISSSHSVAEDNGTVGTAAPSEIKETSFVPAKLESKSLKESEMDVVASGSQETVLKENPVEEKTFISPKKITVAKKAKPVKKKNEKSAIKKSVKPAVKKKPVEKVKIRKTKKAALPKVKKSIRKKAKVLVKKKASIKSIIKKKIIKKGKAKKVSGKAVKKAPAKKGRKKRR